MVTAKQSTATMDHVTAEGLIFILVGFPLQILVMALTMVIWYRFSPAVSVAVYIVATFLIGVIIYGGAHWLVRRRKCPN